MSRARELAQRLGIPCVDDIATTNARFVLMMDRGRLVLRDRRVKRSRGLVVDFSAINVRTAPGGGGLSKKQPLAKAIGREAKTVVDATAGLAQDAFLLACMGRHVTAIERNPIVAALLEDGLRRATDDPRLARALGGRLALRTGDAREILKSIAPRPDVVYLDPMFPPKRKKSALAKIEVRLLRELVGDDDDADELLAIAMRAAAQRVVVKRPSEAPPLGGEPTMSFEGKLVRYDVYRTGNDETSKRRNVEIE